GSGMASTPPFAYYDPESCCWRTSQGTFPWVSDEYSGAWPRRGSMRNGVAFERRTSAPRTAASASSSSPGLLPTPRASDTGTAGRRAGDGFRPPLSQVVLEQVS